MLLPEMASNHQALTMKYLPAIITLGLGLASVPAQAEFSADLAATTDYVWRGVSQTLGNPAVQGGISFSHASGVYAGIWSSNVNFFDPDTPGADPADDDKANVELDYNLGLSGATAQELNWDVGVYHYTYPGAVKALLDSSEEYYAGATYRWANLKLYRDFVSRANYLWAGATATLPHALSLAVGMGRYQVSDSPDYSDYRLALSGTTHGLGVELSYSDTTMGNGRCLDFSGATNLCDGRLVLTLSKHFGKDD